MDDLDLGPLPLPTTEDPGPNPFKQLPDEGRRSLVGTPVGAIGTADPGHVQLITDNYHLTGIMQGIGHLGETLMPAEPGYDPHQDPQLDGDMRRMMPWFIDSKSHQETAVRKARFEENSAREARVSEHGYWYHALIGGALTPDNAIPGVGAVGKGLVKGAAQGAAWGFGLGLGDEAIRLRTSNVGADDVDLTSLMYGTAAGALLGGLGGGLTALKRDPHAQVGAFARAMAEDHVRLDELATRPGFDPNKIGYEALPTADPRDVRAKPVFLELQELMGIGGVWNPVGSALGWLVQTGHRAISDWATLVGGDFAFLLGENAKGQSAGASVHLLAGRWRALGADAIRGIDNDYATYLGSPDALAPVGMNLRVQGAKLGDAVRSARGKTRSDGRLSVDEYQRAVTRARMQGGVTVDTEWLRDKSPAAVKAVNDGAQKLGKFLDQAREEAIKHGYFGPDSLKQKTTKLLDRHDKNAKEIAALEAKRTTATGGTTTTTTTPNSTTTTTIGATPGTLTPNEAARLTLLKQHQAELEKEIPEATFKDRRYDTLRSSYTAMMGEVVRLRGLVKDAPYEGRKGFYDAIRLQIEQARPLHEELRALEEEGIWGSRPSRARFEMQPVQTGFAAPDVAANRNVPGEGMPVPANDQPGLPPGMAPPANDRPDVSRETSGVSAGDTAGDTTIEVQGQAVKAYATTEPAFNPPANDSGVTFMPFEGQAREPVIQGGTKDEALNAVADRAPSFEAYRDDALKAVAEAFDNGGFSPEMYDRLKYGIEIKLPADLDDIPLDERHFIENKLLIIGMDNSGPAMTKIKLEVMLREAAAKRIEAIVVKALEGREVVPGYETFKTGQPVVADTFHGTRRVLKDGEFKLEMSGTGAGGGDTDGVIYSAMNPETTNDYAGYHGPSSTLAEKPTKTSSYEGLDDDVLWAGDKPASKTSWETIADPDGVLGPEEIDDAYQQYKDGWAESKALAELDKKIEAGIAKLEADKKIEAIFAELEALGGKTSDQEPFEPAPVTFGKKKPTGPLDAKAPFTYDEWLAQYPHIKKDSVEAIEAIEGYHIYTAEWTPASAGADAVPERAPNVVMSRVRMNNPLVYDNVEALGWSPQRNRDLIARARAEGRDGVIILNTRDGGSTDHIFITFSPDQMRWRFDPEAHARKKLHANFVERLGEPVPVGRPDNDNYLPLDDETELPRRADGSRTDRLSDAEMVKLEANNDNRKGAGNPADYKGPESDPNYVPRLWDKEAIRANPDALREAFRKWHAEQGVDHFSDDDWAKILDNILSGRGTASADGTPIGGSFRIGRKLDIPNERVTDFIEDRAQDLLHFYSGRFGPGFEMHRMLGSRDGRLSMYDAQLQAISERQGTEQELLNFAAQTRKRQEFLRDQVLGDLASKDELTYTKVGVEAIKAWVMTTSMGKVLFSQIPEIARPMMVHGFTTNYQFMTETVIGNMAGFKQELGHLLPVVGEVLDTVLGMAGYRMFEMGDLTSLPGSRGAERARAVLKPFLDFANGPYNILNLMGPITDVMKGYTMVLSSHLLIEDIQRVARGTAGKKTIARLGGVGLNNETVAALAAMPFDKSGRLNLSNFDAWPEGNEVLKQRFAAAIRGEVNRVINTPGPSTKSAIQQGYLDYAEGRRQHALLTIPFQFLSWGLAASQKVTLSALQGRDASMFSGAMGMVGLTILSQYLKTSDAAWERMPWEEKVLSGVEQSGVLGIWGNLNGMLERGTMGQLGMRPSLGLPPQFGDPENTDPLETIGGAGTTKLIDAWRYFADPTLPDWRKAAIGRRAIPLNDIWLWGGLVKDAQRAWNQP